MDSVAELARKAHNLLRVATVAAVQGALCKVAAGGLTSAWIPWFVQRAAGTIEWWAPDVGEQGLWFAPDGRPERGLFLPGIYSDQYAPPTTDPAVHTTHYPDGAHITYDHAAHALNADVPGTITLKASDSITLNAGTQITLDAPQTTSTGKHTIEGLLTYLAGLMGSSGSGAAAQITGAIEHTGGNLSSNGVVLHLHVHGGVEPGGGNTSGPH